jgi:hypothetical protein
MRTSVDAHQGPQGKDLNQVHTHHISKKSKKIFLCYEQLSKLKKKGEVNAYW